MKNKTFYIILAFAASLMFFSSCCKDEGVNNSATPVVKYIRPAQSERSDSLMVEASMGSVVAIIGDDLSGVNEIYFNDQKAKLNPCYVTNTSIVVTVPGSMPTDITNTVTLNTKAGKSCVFDFAVIIPSPVVASADCEWTAAGSVITIYGNYFFAKEDGTIEVLFPGNIVVNTSEVTESTIQCTVPEGALPGTIVVTSLYGTGRSQFTFRDTENRFLDFEDPTSVWNTWGRGAFGTEGGIDNQYLLLKGSTGSWAWPADAMQLYFRNPVQAPLVTEGAVADYALKFEYYCHEWHDTPFLLWFTPNDNTIDVDGQDAQYHWKPYAGNNDFSTSGWRTITIPLTEFNTSKDETETRSIASLDELVNLCGMFFGAADASYNCELWIDNMRLTKIK